MDNFRLSFKIFALLDNTKIIGIQNKVKYFLREIQIYNWQQILEF